ncbi:MAG: methylmalonyl Co-A mutase-associated GTPase MeaB [Verrucomicrobiales bacterium]|nr:methylmalonyl Co-A mutase-associated GTPase MeaB [Verrucomicrobiales bacterium]
MARVAKIMEPKPEPEQARCAARPDTGRVEALAEGIEAGDRTSLARAITLVESRSVAHEADAQALLRRVLPRTGRSRRVGITGVPGVGKSTFLESLGMHLCDTGRRVAVLAIDPSSTRSGGSILGDRTRMERLGAHRSAFIRPSPSGGILGGVARRTRETLLLCEAAGFDVVLVETVGVGQSEVTLRSLVDFLALLLLPGAGDDLQGIKRGVNEMADAVLINKADGANRARAEAARAEQSMALHAVAPVTRGWKVPVELCSGLSGEGVAAFWATVERFYAQLEPKGVVSERRTEQTRQWLEEMTREELWGCFQRDAAVRAERTALDQGLVNGAVTPVEAARRLVRIFRPES